MIIDNKEQELVELLRSADADGRKYALDLLKQWKAFGRAWVNEMKGYLDRDDTDGISRAFKRYNQILEAEMGAG